MFVFTCISLNHIGMYTRFLLDYLRRVFDSTPLHKSRAMCNEVAICFGRVATVNTFRVCGKRYHYGIFSEGTVRKRVFFSHDKPPII